MYGFDPVGSALGWLFMVLALIVAVLGMFAGCANLIVSYRYHHAEPR